MKTILEIMILILSIALFCNLFVVTVLNSNTFSSYCEEDIYEFYEKYIMDNKAFPVEYRSDINEMPKIIKMIKDNPEQYNNIPEDHIIYMDLQMKIVMEDDELKSKILKSAIFIGMTLCAYISIFYSISSYTEFFTFN